MSLSPGARFDRYRIEALIGAGGMGEVYRAHDSKLHRCVALKVLRTKSDGSSGANESDGAARLLREARAAAAFVHANAVAMFDVGEFEGTPYIAMEHVSGRSLRTYVRDASV